MATSRCRSSSANCARYVGADISFVDTTGTLGLDPPRCRWPRRSGRGTLRRPARRSRGTAHRPKVDSSAPRLPTGGQQLCFQRRDNLVHPVKPVTTAETASSRPTIRWRTGSVDFELTGSTGRRQTGWFYEVVETGFNYRLTDVQAVGRARWASLLTSAAAPTSRLRRRTRRLDLSPHPRPCRVRHGITHPIHPAAPKSSTGLPNVASRRRCTTCPSITTRCARLHRGPSRCDEAYAGILGLPIFPLLRRRAVDRDRGASRPGRTRP